MTCIVHKTEGVNRTQTMQQATATLARGIWTTNW